ncbi:imelysin family protein [Mucilaginibacter sp. JRF]|uniref:imelysin family protein n=1 Tax=Mucilaginibacter sp. JRF TaxID=2780088 RepID=UPI00187FC6DD|nr:imelysin family protein [Mucilaginibacter sp. JRF]MBE9583082.1 imelysin family protein [Mucilaginibacter sp. JRF]
MRVFNRTKQIIAIILIAVSALVIACSKSSNPGGPDNNAGGFDKTAMLTNYADALIIPAYTGMQTQLNTFETAVNVFLDVPTTENQVVLKAAFKNAYLQFQHISVDQFGPAERVILNSFLNSFPTDIPAIEGNVTRGSYDLTMNSTTVQQGFPALDHLLFASDALSKLNSAGNANRKKYVKDLLTRMKTLVAGVLSNWKDSYRADFIGNTRSDAGSPIAFMINQFAYEMDQMKGPRIGWPYGKQSGGVQYPQNVEGYNAGISIALATENLTNLKAMYTGGGNGKGMADYLIALKKEQLNTDVLKQFDAAITALKTIPDPYSTALTANRTQIDAAYIEIQKLLTLIKTDVASATGVRITYQDTDGD